jgi:hypothetical protein
MMSGYIKKRYFYYICNIIPFYFLEVFEINKKTKVIIGLISCFIICLFGVYRLMTEASSSSSLFVPILFAVGGFIGLIGNTMELKKMKNNNEI